MMQGVMFGGEGPIMQGTWYNPSTGDAFVVLDSYFEDNQYIVKTTDGRFLKYNQIQNYVQTEMSVEELKRIENEKKQRETKHNDVIPPEVQNIIEGGNNSDDPWADMMIPEDMNIHTNALSKPLGNINDRHIASTSSSAPVQKTAGNLNTAIIDKALSSTVLPKFKVSIEWEDYPSKQIELLEDVMNISKEEILDWYLDNIIVDDILDEVKESIINKICPKEVPNPLKILEKMINMTPPTEASNDFQSDDIPVETNKVKPKKGSKKMKITPSI
jgi:hypothetical protein